MTPQQIALCNLLCSNRFEVVDLLGVNHPTAKWFYRQTGYQISDERRLRVAIWAYRILKLHGHGQEHDYIFSDYEEGFDAQKR